MRSYDNKLWYLDSHGYWCRSEYIGNNKQITLHQHRYIWEKHNGKIPEGFHVHHKDHNPVNNDISNLELISETEHHSNHAKGNKWCVGRKASNKCKEVNRNRMKKAIIQYSVNNELIKRWDAMMDIERELNIYSGSISNCCKGKQKSAGGYVWRYV